MGRQVYFHLAASDQLEFVRKLDENNLALAVEQPQHSPEVVAVRAAEVAEWKPGQFDVILFRAADLSLLQVRPSGYPGEYLIEIDSSPVIQFARCFERDGKLRGGRLYYLTSYLDASGFVIKKPKDFVSWAEDIVKVVKKLCIKDASGDYVGQEANRLRQQGLEFAPM